MKGDLLMKLLNIGQIIRSERQKRGISQEDLVFDICTPATLSRLENNIHTPTRSIYTALLNKIEHLGYVSYSTSDNNIMLYHSTIHDSVYTSLDSNNLDELSSYTHEIKKYYNDPTLIEQFNAAINSFMCTNPNDDTYTSIKDSIKLTITSYTEDEKIDYVLTNNEILLLFALTNYYDKTNNTKQALFILSNLIECINKYNSELNFSSCAKIQNYLISLYIKDKQYETAYSNIKQYINYCKTHSIYSQIVDCAYFETICKYQLKDANPASPVIDAYYYYLANDNYDKAEHLKTLCSEKLHISFKTVFE